MNFPWHLPWPSSCIRNIAAAAAACSSCSRSLASWASAASGSTTSRIRFPSTLRCLASWTAAWSSSHRWALGATQASASSGSASTARTITAAWSTTTSPAASARRTGSCASVSSALASLTTRWVAARVVLVVWAHQFAVEVAPESSPILFFSPWAATRSFELRDPGLQTGQFRQSRSRLFGAHRPSRDLGQTVQHLAHLGGSDRDRVSPMPGRCGVGHGSIPAATTDSHGPEIRGYPPAVVTVGQRLFRSTTGFSRPATGAPHSATIVWSGRGLDTRSLVPRSRYSTTESQPDHRSPATRQAPSPAEDRHHRAFGRTTTTTINV